MNTLIQHQEKACQLSSKYSNLVTGVYVSEYSGKPYIEVSTVDKAKACNEMFVGFNFSCGQYY